MNTIYSIILELALLGLLASMYYFWQKKRILRHAADRRTYLTEEIKCLLSEELQSNENLDYRKYLQVLENTPPTKLTFDKYETLPDQIKSLIDDYNAL